MASSDDLYVSKDGKLSGNKPAKNNKLLQEGKVPFLDKVGFTDLANDTVRDAMDFGKGLAASVKDRLTFKGQRNQITNDIEFNAEEVSIANRHRDAITGILNNTFNGNLFDAGVSALNLANFGTKWKIAYTQDVDRNIYPFKYVYYYKSESSKHNIKEAEDTVKKASFLDEIEDPTILGFTLRIDYENSPLFNNLTKNSSSQNTGNPNSHDVQPAEDGGNDNSTIRANDMKQQSAQTAKVSNSVLNSCLYFIQRYTANHPELNYAEAYLYEFKDCVQKMFVSPESEANPSASAYNIVKYKNSYIYSIKGLNKLNNDFVEYKDNNKEHQSLELVVGEDIRMYAYRMFNLYKNLTWSNNMGKKLIPENLLRFNLYIKVSDMRNYTSSLDNEQFKTDVREGYSRIIYELKDCEFIFPEDENLLPDTLSMGGKEINENYAEMKIKIKYRKVNRIFFSNLFDFNKYNIIGDKYYTPNSSNSYTDLSNMKFSDKQTLKRTSTDNNIPVVQSIGTRIDTLKNKGLLNEDNNDTALTRFAKSVGNKAIKAGATILDDKMQQVKSGINDLGKNVFNNNLSSTVRDLLKDKVQTKSKMLGKSLHLNTGKQFSDTNEVINFSGTHLPTVNKPKEDLHPNTNFKTKSPAEDLHPTTGFKTKAPSEDLHPLTGFTTKAPNEDLHPTTGITTTSPNEDLHPTTGFKVVNPNEDLHPTTGFQTDAPNEDLHPDTGFATISPSEDLHPDTGFKVNNPNEDLHPDTNFNVKSPNEDLHPTIKNDITTPNEDLHPKTDSGITNPTEDVHPTINSNIIAPNEDLHPTSDKGISDPKENVNNSKGSSITAPNENVHPNSNKGIQDPKENVNDNFTKFIKKNIAPPPSGSPLDSFE